MGGGHDTYNKCRSLSEAIKALEVDDAAMNNLEKQTRFECAHPNWSGSCSAYFPEETSNDLDCTMCGPVFIMIAFQRSGLKRLGTKKMKGFSLGLDKFC